MFPSIAADSQTRSQRRERRGNSRNAFSGHFSLSDFESFLLACAAEMKTGHNASKLTALRSGCAPRTFVKSTPARESLRASWFTSRLQPILRKFSGQLRRREFEKPARAEMNKYAAKTSLDVYFQ
jgi:hypothetical protein